MPRAGTRITIAKGIYRDGLDGPYELCVTVGGVTYRDRAPADATDAELRTAYADLVARAHKTTPRATHGSLLADAKTYLRMVGHLASVDDREDHLNAWCELYGNVQRHRLTERDVMTARAQWLQTLAPKTVQHRIDTLRNLFRRLDGRRAPTPCDDVPRLKPPKTIIQRVSDALILKVDRALQAREQDPTKHFDGAKTRARFRVFVTTGKRPCEIMRAQPHDVDLEQRVWVPRDAKGGYCPGVYLNDDMLAAWQLFIDAKAWGPFNHGNFGRVLRSAGWPHDIRPYQARHTTWITASERGADLADIAVGAGHTDTRTTRKMYVPVLNSRLQQLSELLDGRFNGFRVGPTRGTAKTRRVHRHK